MGQAEFQERADMPNLGDIHTHYRTFSQEAGIVHNNYDITEHKVVKSGACEEGEQMQIANTAVEWEMYLRSQTSEQSDTDEQVPIITRHQYAKQAHKMGGEKPPDDLSEKQSFKRRFAKISQSRRRPLLGTSH